MADVNLACATIVSLLPHDLLEVKPELHPADYFIPKGTIKKPGLLIVSDDVHYLVNPDILSEDKNIQFIKVNVKAIECAQSVINDYVVALIGVEPNATPGLFAVKGDFTDPNVVLERFTKEVVQYQQAQGRWFANLIAIADDTYSKTKSPQGISDLQRNAAKWLGLERDWLYEAKQPTKCPYCANGILPDAIVCSTCNHVLDKTKYATLNPVKVLATK